MVLNVIINVIVLKEASKDMSNEELAHQTLQEAMDHGVEEFCICPAGRNSVFFTVLQKSKKIRKFYWYEERSAAFFALGRSRATNRPVGVITTSGTACAEMLPAAMEAFYTSVPLMLITADRPRRFRGSGAPQAAEQVGLFGVYAPFACDLEAGENCSLKHWNRLAPAHLNVCFEEPRKGAQLLENDDCPLDLISKPTSFLSGFRPYIEEKNHLDGFLAKVQFPFVIVSAIRPEARDAVVQFLRELNAPVFLEGTSGIREDRRLQHLRITQTDGIWKSSSDAGYPIDAVLRIGGVPTLRLWRDLEDRQEKVSVFSVSDHPFSGLSWGSVVYVSLEKFFKEYRSRRRFDSDRTLHWFVSDRKGREKQKISFQEKPKAEAALIAALSAKIPIGSHIYLGNSLPIREWDLAATDEERGFFVTASRGVNGIDGQISTFLGLSTPDRPNWAILGDLTALYDMAGPWILPQLSELKVTIVIVNNRGGQIFASMFPYPEFLNSHSLSFEPFAKMWGFYYERWESIPDQVDGEGQGNRIIELVPS